MNIKKNNFKLHFFELYKKFMQTILSPICKIKKPINKTKEHQKLFKDIKNMFLILLCSFLFLIMWVNRVKLYPENVILWFQGNMQSLSMGEGFPLKTEGQKTIAENFKLCGKDIITLTDTSFNVINGSGKIVRCAKHSFSHPCLKSQDIRSIIYDRGGKNFRIESSTKTLYKGSSEKGIIAGAVSDVGIYAIAEKSTSHLGEIGIYNKYGKEKYRFYFSEFYISDITLNSLGTEATIVGIAAESGNICSNIYVLDFQSKTPKLQFKLDTNTVTHVEYLENNTIVAIGNKYMSFINLKSKTVNNFSYGHKIMKFYDLNKKKGICCCLSSSVNDTDGDEILTIDNLGKEVFRVKTDENFLELSHRAHRTVGITQDKILSYNSVGIFEGYLKIENHIKKIILDSNSCAYTLGSGNINKIKINHLITSTN